MILSFLLTFYVILILWYIFGIFGFCIINSKHGIPAAFFISPEIYRGRMEKQVEKKDEKI